MLVRAIDAVTGSYVAGVTTGTDGSYRLYLRDGTYRVQFGDDGIYSSSKFATEWWSDQPTVDSADTIVVPDAGSATVDAVVEPLRSISGTVSWPPGTLAGGCATVEVYSVNSSNVVRQVSACTSNGQGRYTAYVDPGEYLIRTTAPGYEPGWHGGATEVDATVVDVTASDADAVDAALATAASISGVVTDPAGAPLANVYVQVYETINGTYASGGSTASDGSYRVDGLSAGSFTVQFQDSSGTYLNEWFDDVALQASAVVIDVAAGEAVVGVDASLARAGSISGVVTDSTGAPLQDIYVYSVPGYGYGYTAVDGSYRIGGLPAGSYQVRFNGSDDYSGEWFDNAADQGSAAEVVVAAGEAVVGVDASLARAGSISGVVTDSTGAPLQGMYVYANRDGSGYGSSTAADGTYRIDGLTAGSYTVQFQDSTGVYLDEWFDDVADQGSAAEVVVAAGEAVVGVDASLARAGSISGVVTDSTGAPLQDIYVYVATGHGSVFTAVDGSYRIGGLPAGSYQVRFNGSDTYLGEWFDGEAAQASATAIDVAAGEAVSGVDASLVEYGSLAGTVTDAAGDPLVGVYVVATATETGVRWGSYTDSEGQYARDRLVPGEYTVYFYGSGQNLGEWFDDSPTLAGAASVTVESGVATSGIDAELSSGTIGGVVTDPAGRPLASLRVRLSTGASTLTDPTGRYRFDLLAAGDYTVLVEGGNAFASTYYNSSATLEEATIVSLAGGDQRPDVNISLTRKPAQISGLVVRQDSVDCPAPPVPVTTTSTIAESPTNSTVPTPPPPCSSTAPVQSVTVEARPAPSLGTYTRRAYTDTNGRFRFEGLPTGEWTLYVHDSTQNLLPEFWDNEIDAGLATPITVDDVLNESELLIELADSGRISGTVTDIEGSPLTDVWVRARNEAGSVVYSDNTDDNGFYELRGMDTGSYRVQFDSYGIHVDEYYSDAQTLQVATPIAVTRGEVTSGVDAQLDRLGQIIGTVTDPDGNPAVGIRVSASGPSSRSATTNDQGGYAITGLLDGDYTVRFRSLDQRYIDEYYANSIAVADAAVVPAATATVTSGIDASLARYGSLRGKVLDGDGQPASGVTVSVSRGTSFSTITSATTDADGNYELLGLTTGSYKLYFADSLPPIRPTMARWRGRTNRLAVRRGRNWAWPPMHPRCR